METQIQKPVLITITAPTCAGKSHLLNYIRDQAKLPCFVSTTTRPPRKGEREGIDYYFISTEESRAIEDRDGFAELAIFKNYRYGVTKEEFYGKLSKGMAFLIVEPTGIEHYAKPALDAGALWLKYFINVSKNIRLERFRKRMNDDVLKALTEMTMNCEGPDGGLDFNLNIVTNVVHNYTDRLIHLLGPEESWIDEYSWTRILSGVDNPVKNLELIMRDVRDLNQRRS